MASSTTRVLIAAASVVVVIGGLIALRGLTEQTEIRTDTPSDGVEQVEGDGSATGTGPIIRTTNEPEINPTPSRGTGRKVDLSSGPNLTDEETSRLLSVADTVYTSYTMPDASLTSDLFGFTAEPRSVGELDKMFKAEKDPYLRVMIAFELTTMDTPEAINKILELAKDESDPEVLQALLQGLIGSATVEGQKEQTLAALLELRDRIGEPTVRSSIQDIIGEMGTAEAATHLRNWYNDPNAGPADRISAAENLLRARGIDPSLVPEQEAAALYTDIQRMYNSSTDQIEKSQALMALAYGGRSQLPFLEQVANNDPDPALRDMAQRMVKMFSGEGTYGIDPNMTPTPVPTAPTETTPATTE